MKVYHTKNGIKESYIKEIVNNLIFTAWQKYFTLYKVPFKV